MQYKVMPFKADIVAGEGQAKAAAQLEMLVNQQASEGWRYKALESLETIVTTPGQPGIPGSNGCVGIGATAGTPAIPELRKAIQVYVAVFDKD